ncbi:MAG: hypothetical protein QOF58_2129 [Pseudonocardiales bacterium]|nr:hypothetical protein [Pseudonocardiales bacterium]
MKGTFIRSRFMKVPFIDLGGGGHDRQVRSAASPDGKGSVLADATGRARGTRSNQPTRPHRHTYLTRHAGILAEIAVPDPGSDSTKSAPERRCTRWRIAGRPKPDDGEARSKPTPSSRTSKVTTSSM